MRAEVPQFINIEDKFLGIISLKQLLSFFVAFLISFGFFKVLGLLSIPFILIFFGIAFAYSFVKINGRPLIQAIPSIIQFLFSSKTYLWRQPSQFREKIIYLPQIEIAEPEIQPPEMPKTELLPPPPPITFKIISKKEKKEKSPPKPAILIKKPIPQLIHRNPYRGFPLPKFVRYKLTP